MPDAKNITTGVNLMIRKNRSMGWVRGVIAALAFAAWAAPAAAAQPSACPFYSERDVAEMNDLGAKLEIVAFFPDGGVYHTLSVEGAPLQGGKTLTSTIFIAECETLGACVHEIDGHNESHTHMVTYQRIVTKDSGHGNTLLEDTLLYGAIGGNIDDALELELTPGEWTDCFCAVRPDGSACQGGL